MSPPAPIAIIGVGFRLPGQANNLNSLEELLNNGRSGFVPVPADRWNEDGFYGTQQNAKGGIPSKGGYFLQDDISMFDARFFQTSRQEAATMDPKQRILLQTTYEALENAGIPMENVKGSNTAVYVSTFTYDFERMGFRDMQVLSGYHTTSIGPALLSNRLSYFFDLKGPSFTLDTGCSGGLVALHQACQSLRLGESNMAIVGGAQLLLDPDQSTNMSTLGMLNADGHCYAFDSRGSGYGRGEGIATLILKRLDEALADGDPVHSVILNSGLNQDGRSAGSIMSPSGDAQRDLMRTVYAEVGLDPAETPYVEAHGTGTKVGDKNEVASIYQVFCEGKERKNDVVVGSIKSNIGHLEATAGLAGLLKSINVVNSSIIPPQLNYITPKPSLHLDERPIQIPTKRSSLPPGPKRASVNSFGYGGTNSHVIIESLPSYLERTQSPAEICSISNGHKRNGTNGFNETNGHHTNGINDHHTNGYHANGTNGANGYHANGNNGLNGSNEYTEVPFQLFLLSANTEKSVKAYAQSLSDWVASHTPSSDNLSNISHTLLARRSLLPWRQAIVASDANDLSIKLHSARTVRATPHARLAFVFTGQGAQWAGMGRELIKYPAFEASIIKSEKVLSKLGCDWLLSKEMFADEAFSRLGESKLAQPATTGLQIALVDLLSTLGITPSSVVGHSSGEIGAAYAAGALTHESAMEAAYHRGVYSGQAKKRNSVKGSMLAVGLSDSDVQPYLSALKSGEVCVACVNSPSSTTISGDAEALEELKQALDAQSIFARSLRVDTAYHSHHMKNIAADYSASLGKLKTDSTRSDVSFFSTVTGAPKEVGFGSDYWVANLLSKVRFSDGLGLVADEMKTHLANGEHQFTFVEIGPTAALAGPAKQTLTGFKHNYLSVLSRKTDATKTLLSLLGQLIEIGYPLNQNAISSLVPRSTLNRHKIVSDLPGYAFDESSHWAEGRVSAAHRFRKFPTNDLCGILDPASTLHEPRWKHTLNMDAIPWLKDHVIGGTAVFPASGFVGMAIEAYKQLLQLRETKGRVKNFVISRLTLSQAISFPAEEQDSNIELQLTISPSKAGLRWEEFKIFSFDKDSDRWYENCDGLISTETVIENEEVEESNEGDLLASEQLASFQSIQQDSDTTLARDEFYRQLEASGNNYGRSFSLLGDLHRAQNHGWCSLAVPDYAELLPAHHMQPSLVHPSLLDAFSHIAVSLAKEHCNDSSIVVGKIHDFVISSDFTSTPGHKLFLTTANQPQDIRTVDSQLVVFQEDSQGKKVPAFSGFYTFKAFGSVARSNGEGPFSEKKVYSMVYQPDVDLISAEDLSDAQSQTDKDCHDGKLMEYLKLVAFKRPQVQILDVSYAIARAMRPYIPTSTKENGAWRPDRYDIATPSAEAYESSSPWPSYVKFRTLNVEHDLASEELETKYDVILLENSLDSSSIDTVLINIHRLLREGGKLILLGTQSLSLPIDQTNSILRRHSFSGLDIVSTRFGVATSLDDATVSPVASSAKIIFGSDSSPASQAIASSLLQIASKQNQSWTVANTSLENTTASQNETYIILDTSEHALLLNRNAKVFAALKGLFAADANIIWVALQDTQSPTSSSIKSMIRGTSRVVRRENEGTNSALTVFEVEDSVTDASVPGICQQLFKIAQTSTVQESEFVYRNGHVTIPRLKMDQKFLRGVGSRSDDQDKLDEVKYHDQDRPLKLEVEIPGLLNSIRFTDDHLPKILESWEIQVSSRAHGINFKDVFISLGQMPASVKMVGEVSGIVTAVGSEMVDRYKKGDRVMGLFAKPFASSPRINGNLAHVIPEDMSFNIAATIPCVYATAYHCLFEVARFRKGQSILITAASGGVGQAAIQLAQHAGAGEIYVLVGSKSKKQLVMDIYGIPASHVFSSRKTDFKQGVLRLTEGRGVDVVLNSLTGDMLTSAFDCVGKLGTFCEIGKGDIYKDSHLRLNPFDRSVTFAAVDLVAVGEHRPEIVYSHLDSIIRLFEQGRLRPINTSAYRIGQIEEAFRLIAGRKHTGKVVLESPENTVVKATPSQLTQLALSGEAAYVIAGGLGDLGRRLAILLALRGAKHVVLLSRRFLGADEKKELDNSVAQYGTTLHVVKCDIVNESDVLACAEYCQKNSLLVKGVIHSGMVLKDRPFANMTLEEFAAPLAPKVYGTINLDKAFASQDLDFFIMLSSSATIIGNGSQANYTAANSFQDAFAQAHANDSHTSYVALNLGAVLGSGAIQVTSKAQEARLKSISITMTELMMAVEYAMTRQAHEDKLSLAIMGVSRQGLVDAEDVSSLKNPLFRHLPAAESESTTASTANVDIGQQIRNVTTMQEAQALITEAVIAKCASFLDRPIEEIPLNQPLSEIGFDSLVSIELKNWLLRTFDSPVQTADIASASSVLSLATTVSNRTRLIAEGVKLKAQTEQPKTNGAAKADEVSQLPKSEVQVFKCCVKSPPPKLPLFSLDNYLEEYYRTVEPFARNDEELQMVRDCMKAFAEPGSLSARLYDILIERDNDQKSECWISDDVCQSSALHMRHPIAPWTLFMTTHHDSPTPHTQAERAGLLSKVIVDFVDGMEANQIECDWLGPRSLCSHYWTWMFNSARIPVVHCDQMKMYRGSRHVAALNKGHVFKVPLKDEHGTLSVETLQDIFQRILDTNDREDSYVGAMTTDFRDPWAQNREALRAISDTNRAYFQVIDESTFVINLDPGSPKTNEERIGQGIMGDGFNRWFDKTSQFVVHANGRSSHICDHTMIDGTTPMRLNEFIGDAIRTHKFTQSGSALSPKIEPEYFPLESTPELDSHMQRVRRRYRDLCDTKGYRYVKTSTISQRVSHGTGFSSKACLDMTIELASLMHFGFVPAAWEPISTQHFHYGRPDPQQPTSPTVIAFCKAALDENVSVAEKRRLMKVAADEWDTLTKRTQEGAGLFRRTEALLGEMAKLVPKRRVREYTEDQLRNWKWSDSIACMAGYEEDVKLPALFFNDVWNRVYPGNLDPVRNEGEFVDAAGYVFGENVIYLSNRIRENYVACSVVGDADRVAGYEECFHKAATIIRAIVSAK